MSSEGPGGQMRSAFVLVAAAMTAGCGSGTSQPSPLPSYDAQADAVDAAGDAGADPGLTAEPIPVSAPSPPHFYDEQDGLVYSYIAAVSEEDRKKGKAAGDVVSYAYVGIRNGKHVLARVGNAGRILGYSSCAKPCRIITLDDGERLAYNSDSIIGAAFADALAGRLEIAEEERRPSPPDAQRLPLPRTAQGYTAPTEPAASASEVGSE